MARHLPRSVCARPLFPALARGTLAALAWQGATAVAQEPVPAQPPAAETAEAETTEAPAPASDEPTFEVAAFGLAYGTPHPELPPLEAIRRTRLRLGVSPEGHLVAPTSGSRIQTLTLDAMAQGEPRVYEVSGIRSIAEQLRDEFTRRGYSGVLVLPEAASLADADPSANIEIYAAIVGDVRVRSATGGREDDPQLTRIGERSPIQRGSLEAVEDSSLLRQEELDAYLFRLNRHPGRRVDATISGLEPGSVAVEYAVAQEKPWLAYFQVANTGTDATDEIRERFGFIHNQLTGRDDIFQIDYVTAGFDETHAVVASYEAPVFDSERLRWQVYGGYSEYQASDVGVQRLDFEGDDWHVGGDLIFNVYQQRNLFVDVIAGVRYREVSTRNTFTASGGGEQDFILPHVGVQLERADELSRTYALLDLSGNFEDLSDIDRDELVGLGRVDPDESFAIVRADLSTAFYLEPLLDRKAWQDPSTPRSSTLAHEVALGVRGQTGLGARLVPQFQEVVGGLYSVRGYEEAETAGDATVIATAEYRLHVPRLFRPDSQPGEIFGRPFRVAPEAVYGRPDWDLILKGFVDYGHVWNNNAELFEQSSQSLLGTGVGVEVLVRNNISFRGDLGFALDDTEETDAGDSRFHFVFTLLF